MRPREAVAEAHKLRLLGRPLSAKQLAQAVAVLRQELATGEHAFGDNFRRRAGRGRAHVRHKIGNGKINLMADGGNDGDGRFKDCPRDNFLIERPQILQRTTAAREENEIKIR